ncbi:MAG: HAD hydrolase-like protein [Candidatus Thermoplasmatota archaeon]|nr:HAD hydrolase-like protein [Candidatus Thermoplasmatota archaeon]
MKYSLVFDLDGVLLDSESDLSWLTRAAERTLHHFNIKDPLKYIECLYSKNVVRFEEMSKRIGIDPMVLWPIRNRLYTEEKIKGMRNQTIKPFSDITTLYRLNGDYEFSIISNSPQSVVDFFIDHFGYADLFSFGIGRGDTIQDILHMKPHPFLFDRFKEKTSAKRFVYIGDQESDRVFAKNTGMKFYLIDRIRKQHDGFLSLDDLVTYFLSKDDIS